jgi:hypothetical protein
MLSQCSKLRQLELVAWPEESRLIPERYSITITLLLNNCVLPELRYLLLESWCLGNNADAQSVLGGFAGTLRKLRLLDCFLRGKDANADSLAEWADMNLHLDGIQLEDGRLWEFAFPGSSESPALKLTRSRCGSVGGETGSPEKRESRSCVK